MFGLSKELLSQIYASHILIVDDNEINVAFIEKTLLARGFKTLRSVGSGEEALAALDSFKPDMVILDVVMPGIDGFECCEAIRNNPKHKDLPVIIQTTLTVPEMRYKAFVKGATDFVGKPLYPDELCARVIVHLERRLYLRNLVQYKERIAKELDEARKLQFAILPDEHTITDVRNRYQIDIAAHLQSSSEVGGDFWGTKTLFPGQIALWVVDLSGHGVAAALNAFRLQAYIKDHSEFAARPGEYMVHLNEKLLQLLIRGQFATMFYALIDTKGSQLHYATACSPHPIILRAKTGKAEIIDGTGFPLGIAINQFATKTVPFCTGDTLLMYSDALIETPNANGIYINEAMLIEVMSAHKALSADDTVKELLKYFHQHSGGTVRDDLTIVVCKC